MIFYYVGKALKKTLIPIISKEKHILSYALRRGINWCKFFGLKLLKCTKHL